MGYAGEIAGGGSDLLGDQDGYGASLGAYFAFPFHRWAEGRDIPRLRLKEVVLPGLTVDASKRGAASFPVRASAFME